MQFDFDFTLMGLDGNPLTDELQIPLNAGRTLANVIVRQPEARDALKRYDWALQLYKHGAIDLDKAGQEEFKEMIRTLPGLLVLMRGTLLNAMEKRQKAILNKTEDNGKSD
jgi:hypothetical protein